MREVRLAILFSGNGSNLENIYRKMQNLVIDSVLTQNLVQNNRAQSAHLESRPLRGAKNRIQGCRSATADFLLEAESRGSPSKSEKRQLLGTQFKKFGGSGERGAPLLQKETSENNGDRFAKSARDSSPMAQNDKFRVRIAESSIDSADSAKIKLNFAIAISSKESAFGITRCKNLGLKCEVVDYKQNKADFFPKIMQILRNAQIDLVILAGFMKILPPEFNANFRAINIHPSILPLFKGANAIRESFESDMKIAGVSVHFVSDELDGGALIAQDIIYKIDGESLECFEARIHELEYEIYPKAIIKAIQMMGNLVLGMQFRTCGKFWESADFSPALSQNFSQIQKPHHNHFDCDSLHESTANQTKIAKSALDSAESQNLVKNNSCEAPKTRPLRGAKNRIQASSSASADFLLEADKRGTPPKSEKAELLGTQFKKFGGSGAGGAALLREESSENYGNENAESNRDSSPTAQNDNLMKIAESALDSAPSTTNAESANKAQQTIEGIAVEVVGFLDDFQGNFVLSDKARLKSAQCPKSSKSPQDAPKSKLSTKSRLISKDA